MNVFILTGGAAALIIAALWLRAGLLPKKRPVRPRPYTRLPATRASAATRLYILREGQHHLRLVPRGENTRVLTVFNDMACPPTARLVVRHRGPLIEDTPRIAA